MLYSKNGIYIWPYAKKLTLLAIFTLLVGLVGCTNSQKIDEGFIIKGSVGGNYSGSLFLYQGDQLIDSTTISNGKFLFTGKVESPKISSINAEGIGVTDRYFFLENTIIHIDLHIEKKEFKSHELNLVVIDTITGTRSAQIEYEFEKILRQYSSSHAKKDVVYQQLSEIINENSDHPVAGKLLNQMVNDSLFAIEKLKPLYKKLKLQSQDQDLMSNIEKKLSLNENFKIGDKFVHFTLPGKDGTEVSTQELSSKDGYTLVDFWASWCTPCRIQFPKLREIVSQKNNEDFIKIIGVALEEDIKTWKSTIKKDSLSWSNVIDTTAFQGKIARMYNIRFIPRNILLDKEDNIIGINLKPDQLSAKLDSLQIKLN